MDKRMTDWLGVPEIRHPLADIESAKALFQRLPTGDSAAVLESITRWVGQLAEIPDCPLEHRLEVLDTLDRLAKNHQLNLVPEYLEAPRLRRVSESRLWGASFNFWQAMGDAYLACLESFQAAGEGTREVRDQLPVIVGRALRALGLQLKWTQLRYARVEERIWRDLGRAYLFAEHWGFATRVCAIYPGAHGQSTAQRELLKPLVLAMSSADTLTPIQQHIAERLVAHFADRLALHPTPGPGCIFSFDFSMHTAPQRTRKNQVPAPLLRFFGPGTALAGINELTAHIVRHNALPPDTPLRGNLPLAEVRLVLKHLERSWAESASARRSNRRDLFTRLTVVPGLIDTARWVSRMLEADKLSVADPPTAESWIVVDSSHEGYRAVVPGRPGDWLAIGALIGVRSETADVCQMAVLRRITADPDGHHHIGMQLISEVAVPVALFPHTATQAADRRHAGEMAILLSRQPDSAGAVDLLLRPERFVNERRLQMRFGQRVLQLEYITTVEHARDYTWSSYRLLLDV